MTALRWAAWFGYTVGLGFSAWIVVGLVRQRFDLGRAISGGFSLSVAALLVGYVLAHASAAGRGPYVEFGLYLPYFGIAAWAFHYARLLRRGDEMSPSAGRALLWTLPTLLLAPVVMLLLAGLFVF